MYDTVADLVWAVHAIDWATAGKKSNLVKIKCTGLSRWRNLIVWYMCNAKYNWNSKFLDNACINWLTSITPVLWLDAIDLVTFGINSIRKMELLLKASWIPTINRVEWSYWNSTRLTIAMNLSFILSEDIHVSTTRQLNDNCAWKMHQKHIYKMFQLKIKSKAVMDTCHRGEQAWR